MIHGSPGTGSTPALALTSLLASGPLPRLVWRSETEYLELSGRVVGTWAAKVANLLVEQVDAGPGTLVLLDLPPHWRTLTWALGTWLTGACVVAAPAAPAGGDATSPADGAPARAGADAFVNKIPDVDPPGAADGGEPAGPVDPGHVAANSAARVPRYADLDVVVTSSPQVAGAADAAGTELVVLVPLPSFALRLPQPPPGMVLDGASDVAGMPDDLGPVRPGGAEEVVLRTSDGAAITAAGLAGSTWFGAQALAALAAGDVVTVDPRAGVAPERTPAGDPGR